MRKFSLIFISVLFTLLLGGFIFAFYYNYSTGYRAGKVMKFSNKGFPIKTWEGQLFLGGIGGGDGGDMNSTYWNFSVYPGDAQIRKDVQEALDNGYRVKIRYEEKLFKFSWRGDTKYFVIDVEKIPDGGGGG
jgi:hypothetical protein